MLGQPSAVANSPMGEIAIFVSSSCDSGMNWNLWMKTYSNSAWGGWSSSGGGWPSSVSVASAPGRFDLLECWGQDLYWLSFSGNTWADWIRVDSCKSGIPSVTEPRNGLIHVVMRDTAGIIWRTIWDSSLGKWSGWVSLKNSVPAKYDPTTITNANGDVHVFYFGTDDKIYGHDERVPSTSGLNEENQKSSSGEITSNDNTTNIPLLIGVSIASVAGIAIIIGIIVFLRKLKKDTQSLEQYTEALPLE